MTDTDECLTPQWVFEFAEKEYGTFTLDAAANDRNKLVDRWCGPCASSEGLGDNWVASDGLAHSWAGERVWCNCPYSNPLPWVQKAPEADLCVMLLKADFGVAWGRLVHETADEVGLFLTRLKHGGYGKGKGAPWSSMLAVFGLADRCDLPPTPRVYFINGSS